MIAIVGFGNLNIMQYLYKYTAILDKHNVNYDVIYWNRSGAKEPIDFCGNPISYNVTMNTYQPFYKKIFGFIKYSLFLRKQIKSNKYDKLIVLTTQTAIPLYDILTRKYKDKFIYDYRDITKEKRLGFYAKMVRRLIDSSAYTMISSKGFLPEIGVEDCAKIVTAHNTREPIENSGYEVNLSQNDPIRVVFWGMVRQVEHNKKICDALGNDPRFTLTYHGEGFYKELDDYCQSHGYSNISFTGRYELQDLLNFIETTDILHCLYENDTTQKNAMPVKPYDAIRYRLPMVVSKGSYLERFFENCSGAFSADIEDLHLVPDKLYEWYRTLEAESVERDFSAVQKKINNDDSLFGDELIKFIKSH